jgi:heme iron utilization protein
MPFKALPHRASNSAFGNASDPLGAAAPNAYSAVMSQAPSPIRPTDAEAIALAQHLLATARFAALGVLDPDTGSPLVSRIAFGQDATTTPLTLISDLSAHARAIAQDPRVSLLVGEPGTKGDPLTHPRLTLLAHASPIPRHGPEHSALTQLWLSTHPKSKLYIGFADFGFVRFHPLKLYLNGGFGRAFHLTPADLRT